MKNMSNQIKLAVLAIQKQVPSAVFGGSIALSAVGLLDRPIKDIDLFLPHKTSLTKNGLLSIEQSEITSETVTDTNGKQIQRTGFIINGVNCCVFKVDDEELQHSTHSLEGTLINIQNVNYAIMAKKSYADRSGKHKADLAVIYQEIRNITRTVHECIIHSPDISGRCIKCGEQLYFSENEGL